MKLVVYGIMLCSVYFVHPAYGLTNSQSTGDRRPACCAPDSKKGLPPLASHKLPAIKDSSERKLILDVPPEPKDNSIGAADTIRSLASGDSLVNPWFPGKGAIGVKVKVTW